MLRTSPRHHAGVPGYYFSLSDWDRMGQILIVAAALNVVSIVVSGLEGHSSMRIFTEEERNFG